MNPRNVVAQPSGGFSAHDIYYVLFRHKWKIILLTLLGLAAGEGIKRLIKPEYVSEARLLVRYVVETGSQPESAPSVRTPEGDYDSRRGGGDVLLNSELQLLTSYNLVRQVVDAVGARNIVQDTNDPNPELTALGVVRSGITVDIPPPRGSVIQVKFSHPDPQVAQTVLSTLIKHYLVMHREIHMSPEGLQEAARQQDQRRIALERTEAELFRLKKEIGIPLVSLEETKKFYMSQINGISAEILLTQAQLAERGASLGMLTNGVASISTEAPAIPTSSRIPPEKVTAYRQVLNQLDVALRAKAELLLQYTPSHQRVIAAQAMVENAERERAQLEKEYPELALSSSTSSFTSPPGSRTATGTVPPQSIQALQTKLAILNKQLEQIAAEALKLTEKEPEITKLERKLQLDTQAYLDYSAALDQARRNLELNQNQVNNIEVFEDPIPPYPDNKKLIKISRAVSASGLVLGIALAFLIEFYLDQSVRRPAQVERALGLPLFLSIPRLRLNGHGGLKALPAATSDGKPGSGGTAVDRSHGNNPATVYAEALRDRLMMHFQLRGLNHKPKLVGVTSCGHRAGVTTIAANLAAALSETGDGNVLYVDMNQGRGASLYPFQHGKMAVGIRDALEEQTRDSAKVQGNLYVASLADPVSGKVGVVPKTLSGLVPRMKASDYDYIIFDLPPITQTSATSKVAGLLDMTFVIVESEKTQIDFARKATALLTESRANVAAVLNKHRSYLPTRLNTDL